MTLFRNRVFVDYVTLIDASYTKQDFFCPFGRYRYTRLPFRVASVGDTFQKIEKLFSGMPDVLNIADDILIAGFDEQGNELDATLDMVLRVCRQATLKLNTYKCLFRCTSIPFLGEIIS